MSPVWRWCSLLTLLAAAGCWWFFYDDASEVGTAVLGGYRNRWFVANVGLTFLALNGCWLAWVRPKKGTWIRVAALECALLLPLGFGELAAFLGWIDFRPQDGAGYEERPDLGLRRLSGPDQSFQGRVLPDLVRVLGAPGKAFDVRFETDQYGLRNPRDKGTVDIYCAGDSVLVAGLLAVEETVTEELERLLNKTVLNVSEVGASPQESILRLQTINPHLDGRLVLHFLFEGNDLADSAMWRAWLARHAEGPAGSWPDSGLLSGLLARLHGPRRTAGLRRSALFPKDGDDPQRVFFLHEGRTPHNPIEEWPRIVEQLEKNKAGIEGAGGRYAAILVPCKLTVLGPYSAWEPENPLAEPEEWNGPLPAAFEASCTRAEIPFLNLTDALRESAARGELPFFPADTHLTASGHAVMARTIADWLASLEGAGGS